MTISDPVPVPPPGATEVVEATDKGNPVARAIVGAVVAGLLAAIAALNNGDGIVPAEWIAIVVTFLVTGGAVWGIPTVPEGVRRYGKAITAAIATALGVLGTGLADDGYLNQSEWLMALTALLSALLVSQTPEVLQRARTGFVPSVLGPTGPTPPTGR